MMSSFLIEFVGEDAPEVIALRPGGGRDLKLRIVNRSAEERLVQLKSESPRKVDLPLRPAPAGWGRIAPAERLTIPGGEAREITLGLAIPEAAAPGDYLLDFLALNDRDHSGDFASRRLSIAVEGMPEKRFPWLWLIAGALAFAGAVLAVWWLFLRPVVMPDVTGLIEPVARDRVVSAFEERGATAPEFKVSELPMEEDVLSCKGDFIVRNSEPRAGETAVSPVVLTLHCANGLTREEHVLANTREIFRDVGAADDVRLVLASDGRELELWAANRVDARQAAIKYCRLLGFAGLRDWSAPADADACDRPPDYLARYDAGPDRISFGRRADIRAPDGACPVRVERVECKD